MKFFTKVKLNHWWHDHKEMLKIQWKPKSSFIFYLVVFTSGVICSCIVFSILSNRGNGMKRHSMSFDNFLQVRDEFPVLSPYYDGMDSGGGVNRVRKSKTTRGKSKPEGKFILKFLKSKKSKILTFLDQQEALSTLKVAIELKTLGKDDKALRLFKHALALAPKNPEVLTHYGEYLEHNRRDILSADLMYFQVSSFRKNVGNE